jgi:phosphatidylglycerophosphate synthase
MRTSRRGRKIAVADTRDDVEDAAQQVHDSTTMEVLARAGLAARGLVWLVVGLLTASVAFGGGDEQTDQNGALRAVAGQPFGEVLLVVVAVAFLSYGAFRLLAAAVGHRDEQGASRWGRRAISLFTGIAYVFLAVTTATFVLRGGGEDQTTSRTAELMSRTGGRTAVGLIGVALVVIGLVFIVRGIMKRHAKHLEQHRMPPRVRRPAVVVGIVGLVGRGAVFVLLGLFVVRAAVEFDPQEAKGLDAALQSLAAQPYGPVLLVAAAVGLLGYAVWSFVEAAYREISPAPAGTGRG